MIPRKANNINPAEKSEPVRQVVPGLRAKASRKRGHDAVDNDDSPNILSKVSCSGFTLTKDGGLTLKKWPGSPADEALRSMGETLPGRMLEAIFNAANDGKL